MTRGLLPLTDLPSAFAPPEAIKGAFQHGLAVIAQLHERQQEELLAWARVPRAGGRRGDLQSLVSETTIPAEQGFPVHVAVTMMVETLAQDPITVEDFIQAGLQSSSFLEDHAAGIRRFADLIVAARAQLQEQTNISQLQNTVLPTLTTFEMALDFRIEVSNGAVVRSVPVVLAYADTDAEGQVVWFQMDEPSVRDLRDDLSTMLDRIQTTKKSLSIGD